MNNFKVVDTEQLKAKKKQKMKYISKALKKYTSG